MSDNILAIKPGTENLSCPNCNSLANGSAGVRMPKDGDICLCGYCQNINMYEKKDGNWNLVPCPDSILEQIKIDDPDFYSQLIAVKERLREKFGIRKNVR
jgi:hypothetical protein